MSSYRQVDQAQEPSQSEEFNWNSPHGHSTPQFSEDSKSLEQPSGCPACGCTDPGGGSDCAGNGACGSGQDSSEVGIAAPACHSNLGRDLYDPLARLTQLVCVERRSRRKPIASNPAHRMRAVPGPAWTPASTVTFYAARAQVVKVETGVFLRIG